MEEDSNLQTKNHANKFIDVENVIRKKNESLLKLLPKFLLNYIKKIVHENEINGFIEKNGDKKSFDFVDAIITEFGVTVKIEGLENVPDSGACILACNHPLGGLDAIALIKTLEKKRTDIKFLVNDILLHLKNLHTFFVPVNKHGRNSAAAMNDMQQAYSSNGVICIFPAGLVSRKQQGKIKDLEWKKSFIAMAKKHEQNIIPVYIEGQNTDFFYNLSLWRKRLGIKANIEMFYLADEMYKQRNKTIRLIFGKPIVFSTFDNSRSDKEWAQKMKEFVYLLKDNKNILFEK
ncbi:MAG TPA: 1-acyl-sn-glycerol-3-phosphate acyltransferase [Bacteroidia bacterium]|nr:1-acyl-sn-glycerol-3-phosphate acyltransferase [Bacteroidia bacterium]